MYVYDNIQTDMCHREHNLSFMVTNTFHLNCYHHRAAKINQTFLAPIPTTLINQTNEDDIAKLISPKELKTFNLRGAIIESDITNYFGW